MKKKPYSYYKNIVDTLQIRKVFKSSKRFNAKEVITRILPYRMKRIGLKEPLLFRKIFMHTNINEPSLMVKKLIRTELKRKDVFKESYIPKNEFAFVLKTKLYKKNFHKILNNFLFAEPKFAGLIDYIPSEFLENKTLEQQNEIILKFINDYDEKKRQKKFEGNNTTDSDEIANAVVSDWLIKYSKFNVSDDDYIIDD